MTERSFSSIDELIISLDNGMRTVFGRPHSTDRKRPGEALPEAELEETDRRRIEGLMRVNHAGEVSAQALYQGQALAARDHVIREKLNRSAQEENDHLHWCEDRLHEVGGHTSRLNLMWYLGSFGVGVLAGLAGDRWSLGFLAETERQVVRHLDDHLQRLPAHDSRSRAIVTQMKEDEGHHATVAIENGAAELPWPVRRAMSMVSRVMTRTAYYL